MSLEAPGVADERLEQRPVAGVGARAWTLNEERRRGTMDDTRGAVRVRRRRWRRRRCAGRAGRVDWRGGGDQRLDDAGNPEAYYRTGRCGCGSRGRRRPTPLSGGVHEHHGVGRDFRVFRLKDVLVCLVWICFDGRLLYDNCLGERLRMRLGRLERRQQRFRRRTFELEVYR